MRGRGGGEGSRGRALCRWEKEIVTLGPTSADRLILIQTHSYTTVQKMSPGKGAYGISAERGEEFEVTVFCFYLHEINIMQL